MAAERIVDLSQVGELRQMIAARPPAIVHGTSMMLGALVIAAAIWAAQTEARLVVRGAARLRPAAAARAPFEEVASDHVFAEASGRIAAIDVHDGQHVARGDVLLRLDTSKIDNEIARLEREIAAGDAEVAAMMKMAELLDAQLEASRARMEAEITRATRDVHRSQAHRISDARLARVELDDAVREQERAQQLVDQNAGAAADVTAAAARVARARERLSAAGIGIDDGEPEVLRRGLEQARRDRDVRLAQLERERAARQGQLEASRKELANLELERDHATVRAHTAGIVTLGGVAPGDLVTPGKLPLALTEDGGLRVDAAIGVADVAHLRVGQAVRLKLAAYDYQRYGTVDGTITYIAADSTPSTAGGAYYLVSVALGRGELGGGALKVGMTGQIEVITGTESLLSLFVTSIRQTVSL